MHQILLVQYTDFYFDLQLQAIEYSLYRKPMRNFHKSNSTTSLYPQVQDGSHTAKSQKRHLKQLENQVTKSHLAIQNGNQTPGIQTSTLERVQELQKELHYCILSITHEEGKQKILEQLNNMLSSEMSQVQATQRTEDEFKGSSYEKKIKKVEYDIKQLLHKYNQEIAKISCLKELAKSARDQRVVYSNLFNKLQKEIKHYEQLYMQNLIKNEIFLDQKRMTRVKDNKEPTQPSCHSIEENKNGISIIEQHDMKSTYKENTKKQMTPGVTNKKLVKSKNFPEPELFITNLKQTFSKQVPQKIMNDVSLTSIDLGTYSWNTQSMTREKEAQIEKLIALAQCDSLQEVLYIYNTLEKYNQNISAQILEIDQHISNHQQEIQRQKREKRASAAYENRQLKEIMNISKLRKSKKTAFVYPSVSPPQNAQQTVTEICKLLAIQYQNLGDDVLREIDRRIDELGCKIVTERRGIRDSGMLSAQQMRNEDRGICQLLQKIDRFGECQNIFDRSMLKEEYQKQLNKIKKKGKKLT